jgi:predicted GIY-YIG superfamily endonuclease
MTFWVYILRCADNSYYTGHTDNLEKRIGEHDAGAIPGCYTFKRRPLELVFSQDCTTREEALAAEQQIKGWSRKKKEAMMRGDWTEVSRLAKSSTTVRSEPVVRPFDKLTAHHDRIPATVRPEPVEGQSLASVHPSTSSGRMEDDDKLTAHHDRIPATVRPEPVEGQALASVHPSTSSGRTEDDDKLRTNGR